jgi:hypothetical protein
MSRARLARYLKVVPVVALMGVVLVPAPPATAQATRTWVSGVGDDANPCSRTAPCKTFAGAISKTATNGEINTLDPGGFGGVTITKSITINGCTSNMGGVLVSGTNAIVVNALSTSKVTLRCLDINGLTTSLNAVRVLSAKSFKLTDSEIQGFNRNAVDLEASTTLNATIVRNYIHDNNGVGVMVAPTTNATTKAVVRNNEIIDNHCGVVAAQFGIDPAFQYQTNCGVAGPNGQTNTAQVSSFSNLYSDALAVAVFSRGGNSVNRIAKNEIVNNSTGLLGVDGGQVLSFGANLLAGNGNNGTTTGPNIPPVSP